jgi:NADP-dependent alcohol dehydrogenase
MWAATQALNGLIGAGVPQDWATHMLGHELTAMHGLDHAQTLAIVLPALWNEKRDTKRAKLLQYAERVWNITEGSEDERIDAAIAATRNFFEQLGVPTRLSDYGLDGSSIPALLAKLEEHGMTRWAKIRISPWTSAAVFTRLHAKPFLSPLLRELAGRRRVLLPFLAISSRLNATP